jgi:hypothetical protein
MPQLMPLLIDQFRRHALISLLAAVRALGTRRRGSEECFPTCSRCGTFHGGSARCGPPFAQTSLGGGWLGSTASSRQAPSRGRARAPIDAVRKPPLASADGGVASPRTPPQQKNHIGGLKEGGVAVRGRGGGPRMPQGTPMERG